MLSGGPSTGCRTRADRISRRGEDLVGLTHLAHGAGMKDRGAVGERRSFADVMGYEQCGGARCGEHVTEFGEQSVRLGMSRPPRLLGM